MRPIGSGAGRFAWCQSQIVWHNLALVARLEDLEGAVADGQPGLARYSAASIGEDCAVMLALSTKNEHPLPGRSMRATWALARIREHPLHDACLTLVRSFDDGTSVEEIRTRSLALVTATREIVGDVPDALTNDGYFPALALTRDWYKLLDTLHQEGFLLHEWTRRPTPSTIA